MRRPLAALPSLASLIALGVITLPRPAAAVDTDFGGSDFKLRWDNTLRGNVGMRTTAPDPILGANPAFTAGEYSFARGDVNTARLDLLSELDFSYDSRFGARTSFAGWYDLAYRKHSVTIAPGLADANIPSAYAASGNTFSKYVDRRYHGPWGEVLDAFLWARFDAGPVPVTVKAGRHTVNWGESLLLGGAIHGVAYAQAPLDLIKAFANPGTEAKELFRPLTQISANAQLTPELSLAAQYFLQWEPYLYPEGGTFVGPADFAFAGPDGQFANLGGKPVFLKNGGANESNKHDWGAALRYSPELLDGTVGLYYRRYADKLAAVLLVPNPGGEGPLSPVLASPLQYQQFYGESVDMVGASLAKQLFGASVGLEANYRHNTPLASQALGLTVPPAPALVPVLFPNGMPVRTGNSFQARGDTLHGVANAISVLPPTPLWSIASWNVEATYSRLLKVRDNADMFFGEGYGVCRSDPGLTATNLAKTTDDGCATRSAAGIGGGFTPTWYQVFSGVDLLMPLAGSYNFYGNSPVTLGGNEGSGTYSAGIAADIQSTVRLDLKFVGFYGNTLDNGTTVTSSNGLLSLLKNRQSVVLTAKATF